MIASVQSTTALFTALGALVGGVIGFVRWEADRRRDQRLRLDTSFGDNIAKMAYGFPNAGDRSAILAFTTLANIGALIDESRSKKSKQRDEFKYRTTEAVNAVVKDDLDFDQLGDVGFFTTCLESWEPWRTKLGQDKSTRTFLFYRCRQAFRQLHEEDPEYFETIRQNEDGSCEVQDYTEEPRYLRFMYLVSGYSSLLGLVGDNSELRALAREFFSALHNAELATEVFRAYLG
jgi:hypothetical protein